MEDTRRGFMKAVGAAVGGGSILVSGPQQASADPEPAVSESEPAAEPAAEPEAVTTYPVTVGLTDAWSKVDPNGFEMFWLGQPLDAPHPVVTQEAEMVHYEDGLEHRLVAELDAFDLRGRTGTARSWYIARDDHLLFGQELMRPWDVCGLDFLHMEEITIEVR